MTLTLDKGANLSLTKTDPGLTQARVGLGWDVRSTNGADFDLDASAILITADGKVRSDADFIFYNQKSDEAGSVIHQGDNRTGAGDGDDEQITVDLTKVPADIAKVVIVVSIDAAAERNQNFGQVRNSYVRILNDVTQVDIAKYELGEEVATENAVVFAEVYRHNGDWKFKAVGQGYTDGLGGIARDFGVNL
ncbi:TerD family protein [Cryobacterium psychrophilum]|uniref:TerD family protein n=1 Tax=Cryobacterium psychrophilum TaxID=41988 RepID=A0A4Y8KSZ1_9MICO|nr:TerD family protein [Cryobacterium psychrophilum]TDW31283.1 tellurium resistance protein TerD [Cryobacterium psychrophilum]TFD78430.1 TerD family protein [Cryobacterium psychrophilum]